MLNLTPFCWQLERKGDFRLELQMFTAPGAADALVKVLPAEWRPRARGRSTVRFATARGVVAALRALEPQNGPLLAMVATYESLCGRAVRGVPTSDEDQVALRAVCFALLSETVIAGHIPLKRGSA